MNCMLCGKEFKSTTGGTICEQCIKDYSLSEAQVMEASTQQREEQRGRSIINTNPEVRPMGNGFSFLLKVLSVIFFVILAIVGFSVFALTEAIGFAWAFAIFLVAFLLAFLVFVAGFVLADAADDIRQIKNLFIK